MCSSLQQSLRDLSNLSYNKLHWKIFSLLLQLNVFALKMLKYFA